MINKRYLVSKKLGEGRSKVFSVIDTEFPDREVAAKFLPPSASIEEQEFFREEYFILQKLDHPNIIKSFELCKVLTKDEEEDLEIEKFSSFITTEYFPPASLLSYTGLKEEKKLNQIVKQICSVLYYLHQSNYIYYDLKAENILVSESNGSPIIKIIDLGFAKYTLADNENNIQGTPYYIAPELLKNEPHDYRVDFYSLGILLYKIVYGKFPFISDNELDIYKAHIEDEFVLGPSIYSKKLINVISKLIKKKPEERYENALQIILDLQLPIDFGVVKDLVPAKVFSDRKDAFNILNTYLNDNTSNEVFTVTGFDGSGKTSLMLEVFRQKKFSVYVENTKIKTGLEAVKYIFHKIILTEAVYKQKENEYSEIINDVFDKSSKSFYESIKRTFNTLPTGVDLTILLDDYNLYDDFTKESLTEMIRIFQVKGIKIILTESSDFDHASSSLNNLCVIQLNQFTDYQLSEFLDLSYSPTFPKQEIKKYILLYSDLQPGNIKQFIKDLILLKVIKFNNANVTFESSEDIILALQSSHEELYRMRLSNLNSTELKLAQLISAFEISVEQTVLAALLDEPQDVLKSVLSELEKKNIIDSLNLSNAPKINSFNFKKYIYSTISNRIKFHVVLANSVKKLFPDFNTLELSRQYELAGEYVKTVDTLRKEIERTEEISAFAYKRSLLEKMLRFNIPEKLLNALTFELVKTLYKLSDYKSVLENIYKLNDSNFSDADKNELQLIKGSSLIELRATEEGKSILTSLKSSIKDKKLEQKIIVELAHAEFDINNFELAEDYCKILLNEREASLEDQGRILNLLSLIEFQVKGKLKTALEFSLEALKKYEHIQLPRRVAGIHVNIGTFFDIQGNKIEAESHWQKALVINASIGNLEQEASIRLNYGVFHHNNNNFEKAIESWQLARTIFSSIGIQNKMAVAISNIGEVNLQICDFQNAYENLLKSIELFGKLNNPEEELNILFLFGKYWYSIGDVEELYQTLNKFEFISLKENKKSEKKEINHQYLKLLYEMLSGKIILQENEILQLLRSCLTIQEHNYYIEIICTYSEFLIKNCKFNYAFELLNTENLDKIIEQNSIFGAYIYYLRGKIAQAAQGLKEKPSIEYFESALNLLEGQSITELTWKVLYEITNTYWERGNFHKAKKARIYAYELIIMIGENILNSKIRTAYFNHPDRKQALEKLILMSKKTELNEFQQS
jgi:serine/threonine protein kinase